MKIHVGGRTEEGGGTSGRSIVSAIDALRVFGRLIRQPVLGVSLQRRVEVQSYGVELWLLLADYQAAHPQAKVGPIAVNTASSSAILSTPRRAPVL